MSNRKKSSVIVFFILITLSSLTYLLSDYEVKLEYVGKVITEPPLTDFYEKGLSRSYLPGRALKEYLENDLFKVYKWDGSGGRNIIKGPIPYKIRWEDNFVIEDDSIYYICIRCEIKSLTYIYELQNCANDRSVEFTQKSISLIPVRENNVIMIYKGDVRVNNFIRACVELDR